MSDFGTLIDGWTVNRDENGFSLTAQFYSSSFSIPGRGTSISGNGEPSGFSDYIVDMSEAKPLSSAGPWIIEVTARVRLTYTSSTSRTSEKTSTLENRQYKVRKAQLTAWPAKFRNRGLKKSCTYTFEFATVDFYEVSSTLSGASSGIVTALPAWTGLSGSSNGKWRLFSRRLESVYDLDGQTKLKHVVAELIGVPASLSTTWDNDYYGTINFSDL